jgi:hypothetical protein
MRIKITAKFWLRHSTATILHPPLSLRWRSGLVLLSVVTVLLVGSGAASGQIDTDADGLPDAWELMWFGGLPFDGLMDPDNDGANNLAEYLAGTNPVDPESFPLRIWTASSLAPGTVGLDYELTLAASGGFPPYSWMVVSNSLPTGLHLSTNGVISGTPDAATTASFTVRVTGSDSLSSTKDFSLTITALPYTYTTNYGRITITGYTCFGGAATIPDTIYGLPVEEIGNGAFAGCTSLTNVVIGTNVTIIGTAAFERCTNLTSVTIPSSVMAIGNYAFANCTSLTAVTIPSGLMEIIGNYAFAYCTSLTNVLMGADVTSIGDGVFSSCTSLTSVTIPDSITSIGFEAFEDCTSLINVTIPNSVATIWNQTFYHCTSLTSVTIGTNVTSIGSDAFFDCASLTSATIPNSVTNIGSWVFGACTSLTNVTIGTNVSGIGSYAFYHCASLTNVTIPNSVTSIGSGAFSYCYSLTAITVDALNSSYSSTDGILFNKSQTALIQYPAGKAGSYTIPNGVTNIGTAAFESCTNLTSVMIPNSATCIGSEAFSYCTSLTNVTIPMSVTSIGSSAFLFCTSLSAITVDALNPVYSSVDGVLFNKSQTTLIQCPAGKAGSVTLPNSVTSIGSYAFSDCANLIGVYFQGNAPSLGSYAFLGANNVSVYYVPGTTGWDQWVSPPPAVLWNPQAQTIGVRTNQFGFNITGSSNLVVVAEACTNLAHPVWSPVGTSTLTSGSSYFSDPQWTNYPTRLYRIRSP